MFGSQTYLDEPPRDTFTHFLLVSCCFVQEVWFQEKTPRVRCAVKPPRDDGHDRTERSRELDAVNDARPNNNTAAMARLVPFLFVQKCHGRAETAHVTVERGGQKYLQNCMRKGTAAGPESTRPLHVVKRDVTNRLLITSNTCSLHMRW